MRFDWEVLTQGSRELDPQLLLLGHEDTAFVLDCIMKMDAMG